MEWKGRKNDQKWGVGRVDVEIKENIVVGEKSTTPTTSKFWF